MVRQPKKLTDCPENLRESIDWLIQVRYGGDGQGQGLGNLAHALKKLIGEAITKAADSLTERQKQLECPKKHYKNDSGPDNSLSYCDHLNDQIKKLQSENHKDENQIKKLQTQYYDHYAEVHSSDTKRDTAKKDLDEKRISLGKLEENLKIFTENDKTEECKNLLTNLTDGLEKFLGFNKDSKGYSGSGIVYSDLDRLCDGVMAFLHGVLEAVKEDESVKKYDGYITPQDRLNSVLDLITKQIGNGASGISTSVDSAKGWLDGYGNKLNEKVDDVSGLLDNLQRSIGDAERTLDGNKDKNLATQISALKSATGWFPEKVRNVENFMGRLDEILQEKLTPSFNLIDQAVKAYDMAAKNYDMKVIVATAWSELRSLEDKVKQNVDTRVKKLNVELQTAFQRDIKNPIERLQNAIDGVNNDLQRWINEAEEVLKEALTKTENILQMVQDSHKNNETNDKKTKITEYAETLRDKAIELRAAAVAARDAVQHQVTQALTQVVQLDLAVRTDLNDLKGQLLAEIGTYVREKLLRTIKGQVGSIKGNSGGKKGIEGIKTKVKDYAKTLSAKQEFGISVETWIQDILQNNGVVTEAIGEYVKMSRRSSRVQFNDHVHNTQNELNSDNIKQIAQQIRGLLDEGLINDISFDHDTEDNVQGDIDTVHSRIENFVVLLDAKLNGGKQLSGDTNKFVAHIAMEMNKFVAAEGSELGSQSYLESAVKTILAALRAKANQAAQQLESFAGTENTEGNMGHNVDEAIKVATPLFDTLEKALSRDTISSLPRDSPYKVDATMTGILRQEIGTGNGHGQVTLAATKFSHYLRSVDTSSINTGKTALIGATDKSEGLLPEKIGDIKREVTKKLSDNGIKDIIDERNRTFEKPFAEIQNQLQQLTELVDGGSGKGGSSFLKEIKIDKKGVKTLLVDLQSGLGNEHVWDAFTKGLSQIQTRLHNIIGDAGSVSTDTLQGIIAKANSFHTQIETDAQLCIEDIKIHVKQQVGSTTANIQKKARSLYATRKKEELEALKLIVEKQKRTIDCIILEDKTTGVKGLVRVLIGNSKVPYSDGDGVPPNLLDQLKNALKVDDLTKLSELSTKWKDYVDNIMEYCRYQVDGEDEEDVKSMTLTKPKTTEHVTPLTKHKNEFDALLNHLQNNTTKVYNFDKTFVDLHARLKASISSLIPTQFANPRHPELLDALKSGMTKFTAELSHAYVNAYSGESVTWEETKKPGDTSSETVLSTEGLNCAKVCLTIMERVYYDLYTLWDKCKVKGEWKDKYIRLYDVDSKGIKSSNPLGTFFAIRGYKVNSEQGKQTGELQDKDSMKGEEIHTKLLTKENINISNIRLLVDWKNNKNSVPATASNGNIQISLYDLALFLRDDFRKYYEVCQHTVIDSPKAPCNIYQMFQWLSGLRFNPMYSKLQGHFMTLFEKPKGQEAKLYKEFSDTELKLVGTTTITPKELKDKLDQVCLRSQLVLIGILGHGHPDGRYACEFRTNFDNLNYPSSPGACFDMLLDILNRVFYQSYFVYSQCRNSSSSSGWAECYYGRGVGGSNWNCNSMQCPNQDAGQTATQNSNQKHNQTCSQNCNQSVKCGLKSPLQSYLEDGLPGFLPHTFTSPGCKLTCTLSSHHGIPCLTPMGFTDIGVAASHTKNGAHLFGALRDFCNPGSHLNQLCSYLQCLLRRPPQTLCDMLAFYHRYLQNWGSKDTVHKRDAFADAVKKANFGQAYTDLNPTSIQQSKTHSPGHSKGDLFSLTDCYHNTNSGLPCGKYLQPLFLDIYDIYSKDRAGNYLSWVVYSTETFLTLLYDLYESCKKCEKPGTRCYEKSCSKECKVKYTDEKEQHSTPSNKDKHTTDCYSMVKCLDTHPTLYKYGFTFGSPHKLSGQDKEAKLKRTCKDFCQALKRVIDEFIWEIRQKFSITLLALWSLSLLYLLHIAVVRLDVLRIRSHLRLPASHRIAAQSLLAAARVGKLGKVRYFSP
ncbi:hypothetical protein, conserved [Babesia ovata]|uniref:Uncharacterized protein n=1 Tax=Babesia ovata TaxID=189622 RepID=A0A2H6K7P7_9APIC|nr:uncharacterized protein BOVATA_005100 [Babesia ovata]GBE59017.1 hypothetical protein, conserved [Babesia ovata]